MLARLEALVVRALWPTTPSAGELVSTTTERSLSVWSTARVQGQCWEPHGLRRGKEGFLACPNIHCGATTGYVDPPRQTSAVVVVLYRTCITSACHRW
jgi:hypothetical protein